MSQILKDFFKYLLFSSLAVVCLSFVMAACSKPSKLTEEVVSTKSQAENQSQKQWIADEQALTILFETLKENNFPPEKVVEILDKVTPHLNTSEAKWKLIYLKLEYMAYTK